MASLGRWLSSKSRSGRRPISVSNLLKKEKAGTLFKLSQDQALEYRTSAEFLDKGVVQRWHDRMLKRRGENEDGSLKHASATHDLDYADNEFDTTGLPAQLKKKRFEFPSRDEVDVTPNP